MLVITMVVVDVVVVMTGKISGIVLVMVVEKLKVVETSGGTTVDVEVTTVVLDVVTVDGGKVLVDVLAVSTNVILLRI